MLVLAALMLVHSQVREVMPLEEKSVLSKSLDVVERGWSQVPGHILRPLTGCRSHKTTPVNIDTYAPMH